MVDVATFLGAEKQFAKKEMLSVLEFEIQLAKYSLPREQRRNASRYVCKSKCITFTKQFLFTYISITLFFL